MQEIRVQSLDQEGPLEKEIAIHRRFLAWEIQWTEDLVGSSPWDCRRVGYKLATKQQLQEYLFIQSHTVC